MDKPYCNYLLPFDVIHTNFIDFFLSAVTSLSIECNFICEYVL
jgi:hypothetical protein